MNVAAPDGGAMVTGSTASNTGGVPPAAPTATPSGETFVKRAVMGQRLGIASARLALERSRRPAIRDYAADILRQHQANARRLDALLKRSGFKPIPPGLDKEEQATFDGLRKASDAEFDRTFLDEQADIHRDIMVLMDAYGHGGEDAALKAFAEELAPRSLSTLRLVLRLDRAGADGTVWRLRP